MRKYTVAMLTLGACAAAPGAGEPKVTATPRVTANALSPAWLADGLLTSGVLDATSAAAMGATVHARKVLAYAVGCALSDDQSITFTLDSTEFIDDGAIGMAPGWVTDGLSASEAGWVSACVFARVNLTSTGVVISARGESLGLETTTDEVGDFQIEEGAFWGNVFTNLGSITGYACNGVDQAADDSYGDLALRQCAQWDGVTNSNLTPCAMHYAGLCTDACASSAPYDGCSFQSGTASSQVITSYLYGTPE